jgi:methanogenic corrinoid protein MtbC1
MINLDDISLSLQSGKATETSALITKAFEEHYSVETILKQGLIPGIKNMERRLIRNEILLPEMLVATRAVNMGLKALRHLLPTPSEAPKATVVIGTVKGELRDVDKNLIAVMMEGLGMRVIDLGIGVSPEKFIMTAAAENARFIVCLAMATTTMPQLKIVVQTAALTGIRSKVKILITGKTITEQYCQAIGADFYAPDPAGAAELIAAQCETNTE